jgi:hypothetical protein
MHNFSYLGGFIGIFTAALYLMAERIRLSSRCAGKPSARPPLAERLAAVAQQSSMSN